MGTVKIQSPKIDLTSGLLLLALATVWGGSFFFAEIALTEVPPLTVTLHRVFWAVPVLLIIVLWQGIEIPKSSLVLLLSYGRVEQCHSVFADILGSDDN